MIIFTGHRTMMCHEMHIRVIKETTPEMRFDLQYLDSICV